VFVVGERASSDDPVCKKRIQGSGVKRRGRPRKKKKNKNSRKKKWLSGLWTGARPGVKKTANEAKQKKRQGGGKVSGRHANNCAALMVISEAVLTGAQKETVPYAKALQRLSRNKKGQPLRQIRKPMKKTNSNDKNSSITCSDVSGGGEKKNESP